MGEGLRSWPLRFHGDQRGAISILSVFAVLMLTALLGMVMNTGRQIDGKVRLQNAADAAAYSGGVVVARGMNVLVFTNRLLCEVFALTAFSREAAEQHSDKYVPKILAAWKKAGEQFQKSAFPKFQRLGVAIVKQAPLEQKLADAFSAWAKAAGEIIRPTLEQILQEEMIPQFQRAVVLSYPDIAQEAALRAALANGNPAHGRGDLCGVLWRTGASTGSAPMPVAGGGGIEIRALPVVDPVGDAGLVSSSQVEDARTQRRRVARSYLGIGGPGGFSYSARMGGWTAWTWNDQVLVFFDQRAKMCQFATLWRGFTCGQLEKLLKEYPDTNLPFLIRTAKDDVANSNNHLDDQFTFVGVAYWNQLANMAPRIFFNPMPAASVAFAQVRMFIPHRRLVWLHGGGPSWSQPIGGVPGNFPGLPAPGDGESQPPTPPDTPDPPSNEGEDYVVRRQPGFVEDWDLWNQNWTVQLVPATHVSIPTILQQSPNVPGFDAQQYQLPNLQGLTMDQIGRINTH